MSQPQLSTEERLKAARKRFEELKRKNKVPLKGSMVQKQPANGETEPNSATGTGPSAHAAIDDSKEQIAELTETVELQKSQIRKLRDENTDLKLERMDLKDKITELEKQLAALRAPKPNAVPLPVPQPPKDVLAPTEPPAEPPISHSSSPVKAPVVESPKKANTGDFREALLAWKGWQVDMRSWNGLQGAQAAL